MSTFDGIVPQFPDIRIDYFRHHDGNSPPKACFVSHVHSDHLQGLESLRMPFVYCSHTTRSLLLKMEKYPHRINFSKGILEARKQTYNSLKKLLRPLPLETPVQLELSPKVKIRVTLFDANHCPGAVMFLIEGNGKAVLYTGDIRAEDWWIKSLLRSPVIVPYATGLQTLDCIYLDTTFASHQDIHRDFPSKAAGLKELITRVRCCRPDSKFYFRAWTLGYEDVWLTLSNELNAKIHVDQYQHRLFRAAAENEPASASALTGFKVGNADHPGCLTVDQSARIHSCEPGTPCHNALKADKNVVWITPIISRLRDGTELAEIGAGGGKGDLYRRHEVELNNLNPFILESLRKLCNNVVGDPTTAVKLRDMLTAAHQKDEKIHLDGIPDNDDTDMSIKDFLKLVTSGLNAELAQYRSGTMIHFAYSRHSSYSELQHLVREFRPRDVYPCTVDLDNWEELNLSMESLFGNLCSGQTFQHDLNVREELARRKASNGDTDRTDSGFDTQRTESVRETQEHEELDVVVVAEDQTTMARNGYLQHTNTTGDATAPITFAVEMPVSEAHATPEHTINSAQSTTDDGEETEVEEEDIASASSNAPVEVARTAQIPRSEAVASQTSLVSSQVSSNRSDVIEHIREHVNSQTLTRKRKRRTPGEKLRDAWYTANGGSDVYFPTEDCVVLSQADSSEKHRDVRP